MAPGQASKPSFSELFEKAKAAEAAKKPRFTRPSRKSGAWTVIGSFVVVGVFTALSGGFSTFLAVAGEILSMDLAAAKALGTPAKFAEIVGATVVFGLVAAILASFLVRVFHAPKSILEISALFATENPKHQFRNIMFLLIAEELFARALFLGLGTKLPGFGGFWGFVALFFIGNLLWALVHIFNFKDKKDRRVIIVLPQLVAGALFTTAYVSIGLIGAIMAHVVYDMILFAKDRKDVFNAGEMALIAYHTLLGGAAFWWLADNDRSVMDVSRWFQYVDSSQLALPGWTFGDYVALAVFMTSVVTVALELLLFDREGGNSLGEAVHHWWTTTVILTLAAPVIVLVLGELFDAWIGFHVLVASIIITFYAMSASGSGVARAFWEATLVTPVIVSCVLALGVGTGGLVALAIAGLWLVDRLIRFYDKDTWEETPPATKAAAV